MKTSTKVKAKKPLILIKQSEAFLQWLYEKHFKYGGLWFQWWKSKGEKSWEKYLNDYYSKHKFSA